MADSTTENKKDQAETLFRKKTLWHSFTSSLYRAFSGACFFGLLSTLVRSAIDLAAGGDAAIHAGQMFGASPLLVMGAFGALGTAFVYMAERENTKVKAIGDEHRAMLEAKHVQELATEQSQAINAQPARADGKPWAQTLQPGEQQMVRA